MNKVRQSIQKAVCLTLLIGILSVLCPGTLADTSDRLLTIPVSVETVEEEAFAGSGAAVVVITSGVQTIGKRAFADCEELTDVVLPNHDIDIANDAFSGCGNVVFHTFSGTKNELWALSHGFQCESENPDVLNQSNAMLTRFGIPSSSLQSENRNYATCRLIVKMSGDHLPDISAFEPTEIIQAGRNRFFIQFDGVDNTRLCCEALESGRSGNGVVWVEPDAYYSAMEPLVSQQGVAAGWSQDDPMNFSVYAEFVKNESTGSVCVAVLDSGFPSNAAYNSKLLSSGKSFSLDGKGWRVDGFGHGRTVAAVIAECVGEANVKILPIKIADGAGRVDTISLLLGLEYAAQQGASIINLSIDYEDPNFTSEALEDAIRNCSATVVAAVGNFGNSHSRTEYFPARLSGVVSVGAIESNYALSSYSCSNAAYAAPGSVSAGGYSDSGTSFSAPQIAAALALLRLDPYHGQEEFDACCRKISKVGVGMPQLEKLAQKSVVSVTMSNVPDQVLYGDFFNLEWAVLPRDATDKTVTCESSNPDVIEIRTNTSGDILIMAKAAGEATLTIRSNSNPDVYSTKTVQVIKRIQLLELQGPADNTVYMHQSATLTPVYTPSDASIKALTWESSKSSVLSVENGVVTPHQEGTATITAKTTDGSGLQASITLTVQDRPLAESITVTAVNPPEIANVGDTLQLNATVAPELALQEVTWESLFTDIATVNTNGLVTFHKAGTAVISALSKDGSNIRGNYQIQVKKSVISVSLNYSTASLVVDDTLSLTATVLPSDATTKTVTWTSSNNSVATVNNNGVVTAKAAGTSTITVTTADGGKQATCNVTVQAKSISISETSRTDVSRDGGSWQITVTANSAWTASSNSSWLTVNTTGASGNATVTVTAAANTGASRTGKVTFTCGTVTVTYTVTQNPSTYTYSIVYKSTNGRDLGSSSATYAYGTTNTITAPAKSGYTTPASQSVAWDSTSKTITFSYAPAAVSNSEKSAQWSTSPKMWYNVTLQYQNRTANSVQVRIVWKTTIQSYGYDVYRQSYSGTVTGSSAVSIPQVTVVAFNEWKTGTSGDKSKTGTSSWVTVPLSTMDKTTVSVHVEYYQYNSNGLNMYNYSGVSRVDETWTMNIPAY